MMERQGQVSVVIPTRDRAALVVRALASVVAQTTAVREVIVVDDGSVDDTAAVLDACTVPDLVRCSGPATGPAAARNEGIGRATADWIAFLDDDDEWTPGHLTALIEAVSAGPDVVGVSALAEEVDRDGGRRPGPVPPVADLVAAATHGWAPVASTVMVRRDAVERVGGFRPDLSRSEDRELWLRLALAGRWVLVPVRTVIHHGHGGPRLTDDRDAIVRADAVVEALHHVAVRRRTGRRAARRWYGLAVGRPAFARVLAGTGGRRSAWRCLRALGPDWPRSGPSLVRPALVGLLGRDGYSRWRDRYRRLRRAPGRRVSADPPPVRRARPRLRFGGQTGTGGPP